MPTITYIGTRYQRPNPDKTHRDFIRGESREVTTAWLDRYGLRFGDDFRIEGWSRDDEEVTVDEGLDGVPDKSWSRADIQTWLAGYDIKPKGYATKTTLLELVATVMSPDGVAETEALVEDSAEEESLESEE